jgi:hypothetical protein
LRGFLLITVASALTNPNIALSTLELQNRWCNNIISGSNLLPSSVNRLIAGVGWDFTNGGVLPEYEIIENDLAIFSYLQQ